MGTTRIRDGRTDAWTTDGRPRPEADGGGMEEALLKCESKKREGDGGGTCFGLSVCVCALV